MWISTLAPCIKCYMFYTHFSCHVQSTAYELILYIGPADDAHVKVNVIVTNVTNINIKVLVSDLSLASCFDLHKVVSPT